MTRASIIPLLCLVFIGQVRSYGQEFAALPGFTPAVKQRLFLLSRSKLTSVSCDPFGICSKQAELISDDVADFALDESRMRLYWIDTQAGFYVKQFPDGIPVKALEQDLWRVKNISYDFDKCKLNLVNANDTASKPVCVTSFNSKVFDNQFDPFTNKFDGRKFGRTVYDQQAGLMFVSVYPVNNRTNIYRLKPDGSEKKLVAENASLWFDVDPASQRLFYTKGWAVVGVNYEGNNRTSFIVNKEYDVMDISIDEYQRIWVAISEKPSVNQPDQKILWCEFYGKCWTMDVPKPAQTIQKIRAWQVVEESLTNCTTRSDCQDDCLLSPCWPFSECHCGEQGRCVPSTRELRRMRKRQIPYDMYTPQSTFRPGPQPPLGSINPALFFFPSIFGK